MARKVRLERFPLLARDARLFEDAQEELFADISVMRVGDGKRDIAASHHAMFSTWLWASEPHLSQADNQVTPLGRANARHQTPALG